MGLVKKTGHSALNRLSDVFMEVRIRQSDPYVQVGRSALCFHWLLICKEFEGYQRTTNNRIELNFNNRSETRGFRSADRTLIPSDHSYIDGWWTHRFR